MHSIKTKKLLQLICIYVFFAPILHCLSLLQISKEIPVAINLGFSFVLINLIYLYIFINEKNLWKIDSIELIVLFFLINSLVVSLVNGEINQTLVMRLAGVLTCLSMYAYGRRLILQSNELIEKLANYSILGVIVSIVIMYTAYLKGMPVYFGLGTDYMLLGLSYYIIYKKDLKAILFVIALFVLGGKRGELLVALGLYVYYFLNYKKIETILFLIAVSGPLYMINYENIDILANLLQRFNFNFSEIDFDTLNVLTSYRLDEVVLVWELLNKNMYSLVFGAGLGARYELYGDMVATVHFSPLGIAWIYGIGFSIYLYLILPLYVVWMTKLVGHKESVFWLMVFLSQIFVSLSVFSVLLNPILWLSLGRIMYLISLSKSNNRWNGVQFI